MPTDDEDRRLSNLGQARPVIRQRLIQWALHGEHIEAYLLLEQRLERFIGVMARYRAVQSLRQLPPVTATSSSSMKSRRERISSPSPPEQRVAHLQEHLVDRFGLMGHRSPLSRHVAMDGPDAFIFHLRSGPLALPGTLTTRLRSIRHGITCRSPKQGDEQDYQSAGDDQGKDELKNRRDTCHFWDQEVRCRAIAWRPGLLPPRASPRAPPGSSSLRRATAEQLPEKIVA